MSICYNDNLIEEIVNDNFYDIRQDGTIWARKPLSGPMSKKKIYPLRRVDHLNGDGYLVIRYKDKLIRSHRIIFQKFIGNLDQMLEINHIDCNKQNNNPNNLELVTSKENTKHANDNNLLGIPIKLNIQDVLNIRQDIINSVGIREIGRKYKVSHTTIMKIRDKKTWKHI